MNSGFKEENYFKINKGDIIKLKKIFDIGRDTNVKDYLNRNILLYYITTTIDNLEIYTYQYEQFTYISKYYDGIEYFSIMSFEKIEFEEIKEFNFIW